MLFALRLFAYRLVKPFQWPTSRVVPIPRPTTFVGPGAALKMCDSIAQFGFKRVLIVTDAILVKLGLVEPLRKALADRGVEVAVYDGITPDPTHDVLQRGFEAATAHRADAILAVGGGSVIDAAKVIGAMVVSGKSPAQLVGMLKVGKPMLPLFAVPTTAGTGSEVTVAAVVTDPVAHVKAAVIDPKLVPAAAALDPLLTTGMPKPITAATGMDALTHAVEAYTNRWPHAETAFHAVSDVITALSCLSLSAAMIHLLFGTRALTPDTRRATTLMAVPISPAPAGPGSPRPRRTGRRPAPAQNRARKAGSGRPANWCW